MAVVAGRVLHNQKHIVIALTYIYGVGLATSKQLCEKASINPTTKVKDLEEAQLEKIRTLIGDLTVEGDLRRERDMDIKALMDMGCYRGIRHRRGLPCRGQRTKTNARTRKGRKSRKKAK